MQIKVNRMEPHRQVGNIRSQRIAIAQEGEQELGVRPEELWLMALASDVGAEMERYAEERGWALSALQIEAQDERTDEGAILDIKLYVTAEGLSAPERGRCSARCGRAAGCFGPSIRIWKFISRTVWCRTEPDGARLASAGCFR